MKLLSFLPCHPINLVEGLRQTYLRAIIDINLIRIFDIVAILIFQLLIHCQVFHPSCLIDKIDM